MSGCGAEFTARSTLYVHAKRHNVETAGVTYPCEHPGCNKQYSGKSNLKKHVVRCHGTGQPASNPLTSRSAASVAAAATTSRVPSITTTAGRSNPPELIKVEDAPQSDYIALLLGGDDDDQSSADRSIVTFLAVPTDSLQVGFENNFPLSIGRGG